VRFDYMALCDSVAAFAPPQFRSSVHIKLRRSWTKLATSLSNSSRGFFMSWKRNKSVSATMLTDVTRPTAPKLHRPTSRPLVIRCKCFALDYLRSDPDTILIRHRECTAFNCGSSRARYDGHTASLPREHDDGDSRRSGACNPPQE